MHISLEQLVIAFQALIIVFLAVLLIFDQLKRPKAPREPPPTDVPDDLKRNDSGS